MNIANMSEQLNSMNKAGLIVYLLIIMISNIAFAIFSTEHRFKGWVIYIVYSLFAIFSIISARFVKNFGWLFFFIYIVYILIFLITSAGNPMKTMFLITSYLIFMSIYFGISFLLLFIEGTAGFVIRWIVVILTFGSLQALMYTHLIPKFKIASKHIKKGWFVLLIADVTYLAIIFSQVFYPFQLSKDNLGGVLIFVLTAFFYFFAFIIILNSFTTAVLYNEEKERNGQLQEFAIKDKLTALYNKNYFSTYSENLINIQKQDKNQKTIVLIMDINKFKSINDQYGHLKGDEVLKNTATHIKEVFDEGFECFRFGGDEFVVVGLNQEEGLVKEKIEVLKDNLTKNLNITISIGYNFVDYKNIDPIDTAIKNADKFMYQEKFR